MPNTLRTSCTALWSLSATQPLQEPPLLRRRRLMERMQDKDCLWIFLNNKCLSKGYLYRRKIALGCAISPPPPPRNLLISYMPCISTTLSSFQSAERVLQRFSIYRSHKNLLSQFSQGFSHISYTRKSSDFKSNLTENFVTSRVELRRVQAWASGILLSFRRPGGRMDNSNTSPNQGETDFQVLQSIVVIPTEGRADCIPIIVAATILTALQKSLTCRTIIRDRIEIFKKIPEKLMCLINPVLKMHVSIM